MKHPGYDMTGHYARLTPEALKPEYRTDENLVVQIGGSFLARNPNAMGRTIFVHFSDGDDMACGLQHLERFATVSEIHAYQHRADRGRCVLGAECPTLEQETT